MAAAATAAAAGVVAGVIDRESSCGIEGNARRTPRSPVSDTWRGLQATTALGGVFCTIDIQPHAKACAGDLDELDPLLSHPAQAGLDPSSLPGLQSSCLFGGRASILSAPSARLTHQDRKTSQRQQA